MEEVWNDIPEYEGVYQISNCGRVKSTKSGKILRPQRDIITHYYKHLLSRNSVRRSIVVHVAVAQVFIGPRPVNHDIHHIDGNVSNNEVSNLRYVDRTEHGSFHGKQQTIVLKKLTAEQVREIRHELRNPWRSQTDIAKHYGVSKQLISEIYRGVTYKSVP